MESLKPSLLRLLLEHHATHLAPFDESLVAVKLATVSLEGGGASIHKQDHTGGPCI